MSPATNGDAHGASVAPEIVVLEVHDPVPAGGDGGPRSSLAFRMQDGSLRRIELQALAYVPFRDGVALIDSKRRLMLVRPDGSQAVLANQAGAPPVRGPDGSLFYVVQFGTRAEVHRLDPQGTDRRLASDFSSAGMLSPMASGTLVFVGARSGGIAGIWTVEPTRAARCLSNCELSSGEPLGEDFVPLPGSAASLQLRDGELHYVDAEGHARHVPLLSRPAVLDNQQDALGGAR